MRLPCRTTRLLAPGALALLAGACHATSPAGAGGGGAGAGGGGAGGTPAVPTVCSAGEQRACYDGPPDVVGIGVCQEGTETCSDDGTSWGPCAGEVLPGPPECGSTLDTDCDGAPGCLGETLWAHTITAMSPDTASVAIDPAGDVVIAGAFTGTLLFDDQALATAESATAFVLSIDPAGTVAWSVVLGRGSSLAESVAVDAAGDVFVTWAEPDPPGLLGATMGAHLAKLDASGNLVWSQALGVFVPEADPIVPTCFVASDAAGNLALAGQGQGTFAIGGAPLFPGPLILDGGFAASLTTDGERVWARTFSPSPSLTAVLALPGEVVIAGSTSTPVDLGGGPIEGTNALLVGYGADGAYLFGVSPDGASFATAGSPIVAGPAGGMTYLAATTFDVTPPGCSEETSVELVTLGPDGAKTGGRCFGDGVDVGNATGLAAGSARMTMIGTFATDLGGGFPPSGQVMTAFAAYDAKGGYLYARRVFRDDEVPAEGASSLALDDAGGLAWLSSAGYAGTPDPGTGPIPPPESSTSRLVIRFAP